MGQEDRTKGLLTKEEILGTAVCCMVGWEANKEALEGVPHTRILDLAAVYRCPASIGDGCTVSLLMDRGACRRYGLQEGELAAAARRNTEAIGFSVQRMGGLPRVQGRRPGTMYVLTGRAGAYGASVLLCPDPLDRLAEEVGTDLYILPSSVHEVIAVAAPGMDPSALQGIVKEINRTEGLIRPREVLSDSVYRYSRDEGLACAAPGIKKR